MARTPGISRTSRAVHRVIVVMVACAATLAACGDDPVLEGGGDVVDSTPSTPATEPPPSTTAERDQPPLDVPDLPQTSDFCAFLDEVELVATSMPSETPEDLETLYGYFAFASARATELAPAAIAAEWAVIAESSIRFSEALAEFGWDLAAAMASDDPRLGVNLPAEEAEARLDEYCDADLEPPGPSTGPEGDGQLPFLDDEDLDGLTAYVDAVEETYLAGYEFDRRVAQLRANCEWQGEIPRLREIVGNASSRPAFLPDILIQHTYICPGTVIALEIDLSGAERPFEPDPEGLLAFAAVTNPQVVDDSELFDRFYARLEETCGSREALRTLLSAGGELPTSIIGWHVHVCPELVTQLASDDP